MYIIISTNIITKSREGRHYLKMTENKTLQCNNNLLNTIESNNDVKNENSQLIMEDEGVDTESNNSSKTWIVCGDRIPKSEIVYLTQMIVIFIVIIFCLVQVSRVQNNEFYKNLLCLSVGTIIPNPSPEKKKTSL